MIGARGRFIPSTAGTVRWEIRGKRASLNEYITSLALDKLRISYTFQHRMWGGIGMRGGVSIDFLLHPFDVPLEVLGEYWHTGGLGADDKLRQHRIEAALGRKVINLWGQETERVEDAIKAIKERYRAPV